MGLGNLSGGEIVILMLIVLLVFGANRLPEAGKAVGRGLREFKRALSEAENSIHQLPSSSSRNEELPRDAKPKRLVE
ncbi:MAG: twin-arginine translocase TatA/TatE family subunit [Gemmatimonadetes bacterium]|nr:MAG: twin-arginine translocase TatA/TatE family subunit [Gemmatimonadota bacterium]